MKRIQSQFQLEIQIEFKLDQNKLHLPSIMGVGDPSVLMEMFQHSSLVGKPFDQSEIAAHQRAF